MKNTFFATLLWLLKYIKVADQQSIIQYTFYILFFQMKNEEVWGVQNFAQSLQEGVHLG